MTARQWMWRGGITASALFIALPLWFQVNRADPLFLLPLMGWIALAIPGSGAGPRHSFMIICRNIAISAGLVGAAAWAVSGTLALTQVTILMAAALPLSLAQQAIAADKSLLRRIVLHALIALSWVPFGMAIADASYCWPTASARPRIAMLTSMPLVWGEASGDFSSALAGSFAPAPVLVLLRAAADVRVLDVVSEQSLQSSRVLILIQPRAMAAERLVEIDAWVRRGGRVLWLADPVLNYGHDFPLGDRRNPELTEANLALLVRWGLQLNAPTIASHAALRVHDGRTPLTLRSPGHLVASSSNCQLRANGTIADCRIGAGRAIMLADADMVDPAIWDAASTDSDPHPFAWTSGNGQWLAASVRHLAGAPESRPLARPIWLRASLMR